MADTDVGEVERTTRAIIKQAREDGTLDSEEWTPLRVRREVEKRMSLDEGSLDEQPYKSVVKAAIRSVMEETEEEAEEVKAKPVKKAKPSKATKGEKPRAKAGEASKSKKKDSEPKAPRKRTKKATAPKRSESVVPSSDDEAQGETHATSSAQSPNAAPKRKAQKAVVSDEEVEGGESPEPPKKRQKSTSVHEDAEMKEAPRASPGPASSIDPEAQDHAASSAPSALAEDSGYKSESEMSVLIDDEPPKRAKKGKNTDGSKKSTKEPKTRKSRQPAKELSKDEETIKRLKSFVVACGVRKQWAKEFKGLDRPSEQLRRLKQILSDLGMTGRMSLEQAKAIRAKRELAQELEDVQNFEKSVVSAGSTRSRAKKAQQSQAEEAPEEESEEEVVSKPKRPKGNARQSIMAFLQDQSDDE
ncbi:hypothetical protein FOMPIDRAFT_1059975 [Fomitopsis schrenkii]|uniref:DEK C-terminal domain-containing protein n=1 Tax=Fomitopsis schrenkii TaxID=2126942 RepID=S8E7R5_FOMSC|nr:hypothetical protein FOMPIDRAFT_1059975 [Fomitopsis schrenkii]